MKTNIYDKVDLWHTGASLMSLHDYLGMTWEEYAVWVQTAIIPDRLKDTYYDEQLVVVMEN